VLRGLRYLLRTLLFMVLTELEEAIPLWIQQQEQQQQQMMEQQQQMAQNDPRMMKAQADMAKVQVEQESIQIKREQAAFDNQIAIAKLANEKILVDSKVLEAEAKVSQAQIDSAVRLEEAQTSLETHALDSAAKMAEVRGREHAQKIKEHEMHLATAKHLHEVNKSSAE